MPRPIRILLRAAVTALALSVTFALPAHAAQPAAAPAMPTAAELDAYLASKGSPMTGQGSAFISSGGRWQVDPRLLVAIAGAESSFGQITCAPFNAWGWGCPNGPYRFQSWADGIDTVMKGLRTGYLAEGRTSVAQIHQKYAPVGAANDPTGLNNHWTINVSRFIVEMGGDPNDVDMDGIAGTVPLGPIGGPDIEKFGFSEEAAKRGAGSARLLEVAAGAPRALVVEVRNTGAVAWRARDVRLRRVDLEPRVVGAPYGALANSRAVEPNQVARFVVQLAAVGSSGGMATTSWRVEGPSGPFGTEIQRRVRFSVPDFVAAEPSVDVTAANTGVAGGGSAWNVVVRVRNAGSQPWLRDAEGAAVLLGLVDSEGAALAREGWINERVAARMLEREAAPGEHASFAFRVRAESAVLALRPFRASGWAAGDVAIVELGHVDEDVVAAVRERATPRTSPAAA